MTNLLCGLFFGLGGAVCHKTDDKTDGGGADPAETEARKGQNATDRFDDAIEVAGGTQSGGQGAQQVIKGGDQRKADDPVIDLLIVGEELAEQRQHQRLLRLQNAQAAQWDPAEQQQDDAKDDKGQKARIDADDQKNDRGDVENKLEQQHEHAVFVTGDDLFFHKKHLQT